MKVRLFDQCCQPNGLTGLMAEDTVTRLVSEARDPSLEPPRGERPFPVP